MSLLHEGPTENSAELIDKFLSQLMTIRQIIIEETRNPAFPDFIEEVEKTADAVIQYFENIKKEMNRKVDARLSRVITEVLDPILQETQEIKDRLEDSLAHPTHQKKDYWTTQVPQWIQLYSKWKDKKEIANQVVVSMAEKVANLIEKDIQLIREYWEQSLAHVEPSQKQNVSDLMKQYVDQPLKDLRALKNVQNLSLEEIGNWVSIVEEKRGVYFDILLIKIENAVKGIVPLANDTRDPTLVAEFVNEVALLDKELADILKKIPQLTSEEKEHTHQHLLSLQIHAADLMDMTQNSPELKAQVERILSEIALAITKLKPHEA